MWKHICKQRELSNCAKMGKEKKEKVADRQKKYRDKKEKINKKNAAFRAFSEKRAPWLVAEFDKEFDVNEVSYVDSKFIVIKQNSNNEEQSTEKTIQEQEPAADTSLIGEIRKIRKLHEKRKNFICFIFVLVGVRSLIKHRPCVGG